MAGAEICPYLPHSATCLKQCVSDEFISCEGCFYDICVTQLDNLEMPYTHSHP